MRRRDIVSRSRSRSPVRSLLVVVLAGATLVAGASLGAQEKTAAAAPEFKGSLFGAVPGDATLVVRVPTVKGLLDKVKSSPLAGLEQHPDVKAALADLKTRAAGGLEKARKDLGFDPVEALLALDGEWVITVGNLEALAGAVVEGMTMRQSPNVDPETIPIIISAEARSGGDKVRSSFEKLFAFAEKNGAVRDSAELNGGKVTILSEKKAEAPKAPKGEKDQPGEGEKKEKSDLVARPEEDDKDAPGETADDDDADEDEEEAAPPRPPFKLYVGELGNRFYLSLSRQLLEGCMQKPEFERADGLVANPLFQETHRATGTGDLFFFVNAKQVTKTLGGALSTTFFAFFWQKFEAIFLGSTLNNFAASYAIEGPGLKQAAFVNNGGASDGLLGIFKGDTFAPSKLGPIPADAKTFGSVTFNPAQLHKIVKDTVTFVMSMQGQAADLDALTEGQVGVKFSEVIAGLGKRLHFFGSGAANLENPLAGNNYLLELKEEGAVKKLLKKVSELAQGSFDAEKFKDREIYSVDTGSMGVQVAAADKLLVVSGSRGDVEKVFSLPAAAGAVSAGGESFKKAAQAMPPQVAIVSYNSEEFMKAYAKSVSDQLMKGGIDDEAAPYAKALFAILSYLGEGSGYGVWKEKGLYFLANSAFSAPKTTP